MAGNGLGVETSTTGRSDDRKEALIKAWPAGWSHMLEQWKLNGPDSLWLTYAANYIFRTAGMRWAIDPVRLKCRSPQAEDVDISPLREASLIVMTHAHGDHIDKDILSELAQYDHIKWIVPEHTLKIVKECGVKADQTIVPQEMEPISVGALTVTPFAGRHWEYHGLWGQGKPVAGIDSTGYLFQWADRKLLLPGDTRTYDTSSLPQFGPVDTLLGHVWLGRGKALLDEPPLLNDFCQFLVSLQPSHRVLLTHLWEISRPPEDQWTMRHARKIRTCLSEQLPAGIDIQIPDFWEAVEL